MLFPLIIHVHSVFGRLLQVVRSVLWDHCCVCPVCLSVTLVYCGHMVRWIRIPLGTEVGLSPRDIVLDGKPNSPHGKGHSSPPLFSPCLFRPMFIVAKWLPIPATAELLLFNCLSVVGSLQVDRSPRGEHLWIIRPVFYRPDAFHFIQPYSVTSLK